MLRRFSQVDVFADAPYLGNPVAVVVDGEGLADEEMRRIARWTNLSETTFVLAPTDPAADYRVRIFTTVGELPFAGHPTLGTCHAWLELGGRPADGDLVVQQCAAGLIPIRRRDGRFAFAAPPQVRSGPVDDADLAPVVEAFGLTDDDVVDAEWVDNGPGWMGLLLPSAERVLTCRPRFVDAKVGLVGSHPAGAPAAVEVRGFFPGGGVLAEDPVTGSLNASLAQWLLGTGRLQAPYVAAQGTVLGRAGRVHVTADDDGVWVGGGTVTCITGTIEA